MSWLKLMVRIWEQTWPLQPACWAGREERRESHTAATPTVLHTDPGGEVQEVVE